MYNSNQTYYVATANLHPEALEWLEEVACGRQISLEQAVEEWVMGRV
jgi:hypothetical protein